MEKNNSVSFWLEGKEVATWKVDNMDHEYNCPDPPPQFHLPPPPWPHFFNDFRCLNNVISETETCKTLSVISDGYHYSMTLTTLLAILIFGAVIFFFIGAILVIIRGRKGLQLHARKSSTTSYCESAIASSIIFEDMTDIHLRELTCLNFPCQLPSSEMIRISSCTSQNKLSPVLTHSPSPAPKSFRSKDLFSQRISPFADVYNEKRGTGSERILSNLNSEDECAEDDVSLEEGIESYPNTAGESRSIWLLGIDVADFLKNLDFPPGDDRSRFLGNCGRYPNSASYREKEARIFRGVRFSNSDTEKRLRRSDKKRERKDKYFF